MKKNRVQNIFLEELKKVPIVTIACEKVGVSSNSIYRWKREDSEFAKQMDEALAVGEALINDLGESQLLTLMKEKNFPAIRFWLNHRNPKFRDKVEVTTKADDTGELTPEQEKVVRKALKLASVITNKNHESKSKQSNT